MSARLSNRVGTKGKGTNAPLVAVPGLLQEVEDEQVLVQLRAAPFALGVDDFGEGQLDQLLAHLLFLHGNLFLSLDKYSRLAFLAAWRSEIFIDKDWSCGM